jgi:hypothetical protein
MDPEELAALADPTALGRYLANLPHTSHAQHGPSVSVREDTYRGHKIRIKTTYEVTIDGLPLPIHMDLTNKGELNSHSLPNYQFMSAVDLIKAVIDAYPDDFPPADDAGGQDEPQDGGGGAHHGGGHS